MIAQYRNGMTRSQPAEGTRQPLPNVSPYSTRYATGSASETHRISSAAQVADGAGAFWASLHHRAADRIAYAPIRGWVSAHAHLEPAERHGWPVLVLVLEARPPAETSADLIWRHYRDALAGSTGKTGPLADLARSLELREVAA